MSKQFTGNTTQTDQSDWSAINAMTDADIYHDADSPRTLASDWDGALLKQGGVVIGRVKTRGANIKPLKKQVAIRFDEEVLDYFRATGKGWQTRMNNVLKEWVKEHAV
jgi:uncharacterized protein (DUF4415 family)